MIQYLALRLAAATAPHVPAALGYRATAVIADILHATSRRRRALLAGNLRTVVGDVPAHRLDQMTRAGFRNLVWNYYELFHLAGAGLRRLAAARPVEGAEQLSVEAARTGTGCVIVFAHVGNIEASSQLSLLYPEQRWVLVVEHMSQRRVFELLQRLRRNQGVELVRADEPRRILKLLRAGCHVVIAGDLDSTRAGIVVDLFGRPARVPSGAVKLALRAGAAVLVAELWRESMEEPQRFRARLGPPLSITGSADDRDAVRIGVEQVVRTVEKQIAARPDQWLAFRDVWETPR